MLAIHLTLCLNFISCRSHSPNSPRSKCAGGKPPPTAEEVAKSAQSLETHVKDISNALKYFREIIHKKKLEVLPGNGTVILDSIAKMFSGNFFTFFLCFFFPSMTKSEQF